MIGQNILVIKLGAMGDFIQALGPMAAIKRHHPDDKIILLTTKPFEKIAQLSGHFDDIVCDIRPKWYQPFQWIELSKTLNRMNIARVYDLQNNDRTCFYFSLFHPKPQWVGIAKGASHQNISPLRSMGKAFDGHVQTLALAGIHDVTIDDLNWIKTDKKFDGITKPYVLIVAGASPKHPHKKWPAHYYGDLCRVLVQKGILPVLIGTEHERQTNNQILEIEPKCFDLTAKTDLFDLPSLARGAMGAIGNDTGPMHVIGPTGCHSIVIFGNKTKPQKHAPLGGNVKTIQSENLGSLKVQEIVDLFFN